MSETQTLPSGGRWPANSIYDIERARGILWNSGYFRNQLVLVAHYRVIGSLKNAIANSNYTYLGWMLHFDIIYNYVEDETLPLDEAYLYETNKGMPVLKQFEGLTVIPKDSYIKCTEVHYENE